MEQLHLFGEEPLIAIQSKSAKKILEENVRYGVQFFYDIYESASLLNITYKMVMHLIATYKLDCLKLRGTFRIPYWSLQEYLTDSDRIHSIEKDYYRWVRVQEVAHLRRKGA